jgi:membrane protease YdiL (CAAX protease family)
VWKPTGLFLLLAFGLSGIFYAIVNLTGAVSPWIIMLMWMPALAAILTCLILKRPLSTLGLGRWNTKWAWFAYLIPLAYCLVASLATWIFGLGGFPNTAAPLAWGQVAGIQGLPEWAIIAIFALVTGTAGMITGSASALGEEIGWRGFLVPELYRYLPFTAVSLISGVIWAVWHYAITGVVYKDSELPPWFWLLTFTAVAILISFVLAWLRIKTGSVWPAVFLHASHNLWMQDVFQPLTTDTGPTKYVAGDLGLAFLVVAIAVAIVFWLKRNQLPSREEFIATNV